jgi:hypothetical protein
MNNTLINLLCILFALLSALTAALIIPLDPNLYAPFKKLLCLINFIFFPVLINQLLLQRLDLFFQFLDILLVREISFHHVETLEFRGELFFFFLLLFLLDDRAIKRVKVNLEGISQEVG